MKSKTTLILISSLILTVGYLSSAQAVSDAELEALEKQIEQLETDEKKQADAAEKKKAESEKQRLEETRRIAEEKRLAEEARQAELERQRKEEEAKKRAEEEKKEKYNLFIAEAKQALNSWDKELAINKYSEALKLKPGNRIAIDGINKAEKLILEKGCYDVVGTWESDPSFIQYQDIFKADGTAISTHTNVRTQAKKKYDGIWECLDAEKRIFLYKDNEHIDSKYQIKDGKLCDLGISKICSKRKNRFR